MEILDTHIVQGIKNDEEKYFRYVFDSSYDKLFFFAKEFVQDDDTANSVAQGAFIKLWEKRKELRVDSNLLAWLFTVTKNDCLKLLRKRRKESLVDDSIINFADENIVGLKALEQFDTSELVLKEIHQIVEQTLQQLPPRCREIFQLSRFKELKNREIAQQLNISEKAVEAQMTKALKVLKKNLQDYLPLVSWFVI
ncbi:RNA polymerase sigma-70 factor [Marinilabiliaceae bacterium JC017]|nr:RNA polymerase sigma-70 factor [Marinilabiliaceae bacterium JC017]